MEEALVSFLLADTGITDLVGTRVDFFSSDQAREDPRIVIQLVGKQPQYADDGEVGLTRQRVQCDTYAESRAGALAIARALFARLSAVSQTYSGVGFKTIELEDENAGPEKLDDGRELFRVRQDYVIWHNA